VADENNRFVLGVDDALGRIRVASSESVGFWTTLTS
jgi:hypothetical protein